MSINKVLLIGNLGADPEMRSTANGDAICNLRLATNESWKDRRTGEQRESTEWHTIVLYRKLAEIAERYLKKGHASISRARFATGSGKTRTALSGQAPRSRRHR